jgi:hypothetical protein
LEFPSSLAVRHERGVASGINGIDLGFDNCRSMFRKLPDAQSKTLVVNHKVLSGD